MATGNFDPEAGVGLFSGIFGLLSLIPAIIVHIKRFHDRDKSGCGDYRVARAAYEEAVKRRPGRIVTLRQKTRLLADSRRKN
jgi:uncharacterized membrane protein YhaH (DUF805 family)